MQETLRNNFEKFYKTVKFDPEQFEEATMLSHAVCDFMEKKDVSC